MSRVHVNRSMAQGDLQVAEGTIKGYTVGTILSLVDFVLCNVICVRVKNFSSFDEESDCSCLIDLS